MWGNRLGWTISAVLVVVAAGLGYWLLTLGQASAPTGELTAAAAAVPFKLADVARPLLPPPAAGGNAGERYRAAADDCLAHRAAYDALAHATDYRPADAERLAGLADLLAAAELPNMDLYRSRPELIVNYDAKVPSLDALDTVGRAAAQVALLAAFDKDYDAAGRYGRAVLALGVNLYRERVTFGELSAGLSMMAVGSAGLRDAAERRHDPVAAAGPVALDQARLAEFEQLKKAWAILSGQGEANIEAHTGDFFQLAADASVDPMWRTEAVRRLGRVQRNAAKASDNLRATTVLRAMAADPALPPAVRQAAIAGRDMDSAGYQSTR